MEVAGILTTLMSMVFAFFTGVMCEKIAVGMKPSRSIELWIESIFSLITFKKFFICDKCGKIHRRQIDDLDICGGKFAHKVFVSNHCANETMRDAKKVIRSYMFRNPTSSLSTFLENRANDQEHPLDKYDSEFMKEAAERLNELSAQNQDLRKKYYGG